jgi:hypothetical protein
MKTLEISIFLALILFLSVAVSAQDDSLPRGVDFTNLLNKKNVSNLAIGFSTPNEIKGFEFFSNGKLKGLKLGISKKDDVSVIFGNACEEFCVYDSKWKVQFDYFDEKTITTVMSYDGNGIKSNEKKLVPSAEFLGKIRSVKLVPQQTLSFTGITFPDKFEKRSSVAFGHDFSGNASHVAFDAYTDSYGLVYYVFDKITFSNTKEKDSRQKGDLISIEYTIPNTLEDKMFVERK